jgi:hypothetical protein
MNEMGPVALLVSVLSLAAWLPASAQVPRPFPTVENPARPAPVPPETASPVRPAAPASPDPARTSPSQAPDGTPSEATLGFPVFQGAQFLTSYDAGSGQRYYLFGSTAPFAALVKYYQGALKVRGTLVFEIPATHVFEVGRFREESMAFPPGVTIKDYTWNSAGYLNPRADGKQERFPTVIQIVPAPQGAPR